MNLKVQTLGRGFVWLDTYAGNLANLKDIENKPNYEFVKMDICDFNEWKNIDSTKLQKELGWEPSLQFEEGIEKTFRWYLDNQEWLDNVTSGDYQKYYDNMYANR